MKDLELDWEDLVDAITEFSLIPVVGDEMRLLELDGQTCTVEHWSLQNLPEKLDADTGSTAVTLNELATRILEDVPLKKRERRKRRIARRMVAVFEDRPPPIPETLLKLAEIRYFNLFITTAVDTLLEQAMSRSTKLRSGSHWQKRSGLACLAENPGFDVLARKRRGQPEPYFLIRARYFLPLIGRLASCRSACAASALRTAT